MYITAELKMKLAKEMVKQATKNGGTLHEYEFKGTADTFHEVAAFISDYTGGRVIYSRMLQNINLDGMTWKQIEGWINHYKGE